MNRTKVAIIGSGNIGTDLMMKIMSLSTSLEVAAMVGIDVDSDGLRRAGRLGGPVTAEGVDGLIAMSTFDDIRIVFDATSAKAHVEDARVLSPRGERLIDLTPAAIGPFRRTRGQPPVEPRCTRPAASPRQGRARSPQRLPLANLTSALVTSTAKPHQRMGGRAADRAVSAAGAGETPPPHAPRAIGPGGGPSLTTAFGPHHRAPAS
jgi:hypothetical protein